MKFRSTHTGFWLVHEFPQWREVSFDTQDFVLDIEVPVEERNRRSSKKVDGQRLFNNINIEDIVEKVKAENEVTIGEREDLTEYGVPTIECRRVDLRAFVEKQLSDLASSKLFRDLD